MKYFLNPYSPLFLFNPHLPILLLHPRLPAFLCSSCLPVLEQSFSKLNIFTIYCLCMEIQTTSSMLKTPQLPLREHHQLSGLYQRTETMYKICFNNDAQQSFPIIGFSTSLYKTLQTMHN